MTKPKKKARKPAAEAEAPKPVSIYRWHPRDQAEADAGGRTRREVIAWIGSLRYRLAELYDEVERMVNETRREGTLLTDAVNTKELVQVMAGIEQAETIASVLRATVKTVAGVAPQHAARPGFAGALPYEPTPTPRGASRMSVSLFAAGDHVKLLVSFYAKPAIQTKLRHKITRPAPRFLLSSERLRFVYERPDVRGGAVIEDAAGVRWYCPLDYLTFAPLELTGAD